MNIFYLKKNKNIQPFLVRLQEAEKKKNRKNVINIYIYT